MREAKRRNPTRYWLGKTHSETTRKKISEAQIGRKASEESKLKKARHGIFLSPNGDEVEVLNISEFARNNGLDKARMCELYNGTRRSHKGWTFIRKLNNGWKQ